MRSKPVGTCASNVVHWHVREISSVGMIYQKGTCMEEAGKAGMKTGAITSSASYHGMVEFEGERVSVTAP